MKILLVAPMPPRPNAPGAIPLVLHALLTGLQAHHTITLVTVAGSEPGECEALEQLAAQGIEVHAVRRSALAGWQRWQRRWRLGSTWLQGRYPWRTIWFWEPELQAILDRLLAQPAFDLVVVEDNAMGIYRYPTQAPVIFTEHEVRRSRPMHWNMGSPSHWLAWAFAEADWVRWRRYQAEVWQRFDRLQVFTRRDAEAIGKLAPQLMSRVRVNPFGIVLPEPAPAACEEAGRLLFTGNFTHQPNVDAALWLGEEIMPRLRPLRPDVHLDLVGIYPPPAIQAFACADIAVTGAVPEIEPYLARAAVVVAPIRIGGGMRMKVLQAMALGKAVVTTPRGADGLEVVGQRPPLVIAEDAEGIARAVCDLLADPAGRQALGARARAFVAEHYSPQACVQRLEAIYAELQPR